MTNEKFARLFGGERKNPVNINNKPGKEIAALCKNGCEQNNNNKN